MQPDQWYKASEFESIVGVKESRVKVLFKDMTEQGLIESAGRTKGKKYRKVAKQYGKSSHDQNGYDMNAAWCTASCSL